MFTRPIVFGIDGQSAAQMTAFDDRMVAYGRNTGNAFFSEALYRALANVKRASYAPPMQAFEDCDVVVVAAANWINSYSDFAWLADRLERVQLPIVLVGLGAQAAFGETTPQLSPGTERLLRMAAERSAAISVRGIFTANVLAQHGITNVVITGCPSLLLAGRSAPSAPRLGALSWGECAMHATRGDFDKGDALQRHLYRQALQHDATLVLQAEVPELMLRWNGAHDLARVTELLNEVYGAPSTEVMAFLKRRGQVFNTVDEWVDALANKRFCFGTRFHGTIAALLAGINATLITHDTRTVEMAEIMNVPVVAGTSIAPDKEINPIALYSEDAMQRFQGGYARYLRTFLGFFGINKLSVNAEHFA